MSPEELYRQINFHELTDDDKQELAIQLWEKRHQYNPEIASLSAWVTAAARNFWISKKRKEKNDVNSLTIPLSHFDRTNDENKQTNNYVADFLACDELSPLEWMIDMHDKKKALQNALNKLTKKEQDMVKGILAGSFKFKNSSDRTRFKRMLDKIKQEKVNKEIKRYILTNVDGSKFEVSTLVEAAEIVGCTHELVSRALKKSCLFYKKSWKISKK